jgi:hypothetical protein
MLPFIATKDMIFFQVHFYGAPSKALSFGGNPAISLTFLELFKPFLLLLLLCHYFVFLKSLLGLFLFSFLFFFFWLVYFTFRPLSSVG